MRAYVSAMNALAGLRQRLSRDEQGMQTLEWVGIGAVVVALIGAVTTAIEPVGAAIAGAIETLVGQITGGGGGAA